MTGYGQMTGNNGAMQTMDMDIIGDTDICIGKCLIHNTIREHHSRKSDCDRIAIIIKHGVVYCISF